MNQYQNQQFQDGYKKYHIATINLLKPSLEKIMSEHKVQWLDIHKNMLLGGNAKRISRELNAREKVASKILEGFIEISLSFQSLSDFPIFLSRFPNHFSSKSKYIEFVVTSYLNEVYILSERLEAYTKRVERLYKKNLIVTKKEKVLSELYKKTQDVFSNLIDIRGGHVHQKRFQDEELSRLGYIETFMSDRNLFKSMSSTYNKLVNTSKNNWVLRFRENNIKFQQVLDIYFSVMYQVVFDKNGNLILPS